MATSRKHAIRRDVLESLSRPLLVDLLAPHRDALTAAGLDLDAPASRNLDTDALLVPLYKLATAGRLPDELAARLSAVESLANASGHEVLVAMAYARGEAIADKESLADTAARALLADPELVRKARAQVSSEAPHRFTEYTPSRPVRELPTFVDKALRDAVEVRLKKKKRTVYVSVLRVETDDETLFEVSHGTLPSSKAVLDPATLERSAGVLHFTRQDYLVFDKETGRVAISACSPSEREHLLTTISEASATKGGPSWSLRPTLSLRPLLTKGALAQVPGVAGVFVSELDVRVGGRLEVSLRDGGGDVHEGLSDELAAALRDEAEPHRAVLRIQIEGRRHPVRVELQTPATLKLDRRDAEHTRIVRAFLTARGVLLRATEAA